jgi:hypothetical protein
MKNSVKSKRVFKWLALSGSLLFSACSTIVFDNGVAAQSPDDTWITKKHQIGGIFEMIEFQRPKNLETICGGSDWEHIATEMTFVDGLLRQVVPYGIYAPKTTYTKCSQPVL